MNIVQRIEYIRQLESKKVQLEKDLEFLNKEIEYQKSDCSHIGVDLGYYGYFPSTGDKYRCLICGKGKDDYFYEPKHIVHAEDYLPHFDIKDETQCEEKFTLIQTLAIGIIKENPKMEREEIVSRLNNLIEEANLIRKYNGDMNKLTSVLSTIIESDEYTMLVESTENENMLEYGIVGQEMKKIKFDNLNGENFWEFVYKGICKIAPTSVVNFMNVNAFGNIHSSVTIDLNDRVKAIITNNDHKYDEFISTLEEIMKNSEDVSEKINGEKGPVLSKRIKSL